MQRSSKLNIQQRLLPVFVCRVRSPQKKKKNVLAYRLNPSGFCNFHRFPSVSVCTCSLSRVSESNSCSARGTSFKFVGRRANITQTWRRRWVSKTWIFFTPRPTIRPCDLGIPRVCGYTCCHIGNMQNVIQIHQTHLRSWRSVFSGLGEAKRFPGSSQKSACPCLLASKIGSRFKNPGWSSDSSWLTNIEALQDMSHELIEALPHRHLQLLRVNRCPWAQELAAEL